MQLKILSYNIHRAIGVDRRFRPERIIAILDHHRADIALLQEVDVGVPRSQHLNLAKELADSLGYPHYALGLNVKVKEGHYGNATLSRFPITSQCNIDLSVERRKRRGCLFTIIGVEHPAGAERELAVFNLHLGLSMQERVRQAGLLVRSPPYAQLTPHTPCLVAGDFNDWRGLMAPIFSDILGFTCATSHRTRQLDAILTYPSFSPTGGLDKIFCRGDGLRVLAGRRCRLGVAKVASDHLPVIVDLELD